MVAVDLGRRGHKHAFAKAVAVIEDDLRALDVRDQRMHGLLDDQADADRGSQVVDDIALVNELVNDRRRKHRVHDEVIVPTLAEMCHIFDRRSREVVEGEDFPALEEKEL
jgi:hypothetical protein